MGSTVPLEEAFVNRRTPAAPGRPGSLSEGREPLDERPQLLPDLLVGERAGDLSYPALFEEDEKLGTAVFVTSHVP